MLSAVAAIVVYPFIHVLAFRARLDNFLDEDTNPDFCVSSNWTLELVKDISGKSGDITALVSTGVASPEKIVVKVGAILVDDTISNLALDFTNVAASDKTGFNGKLMTSLAVEIEVYKGLSEAGVSEIAPSSYCTSQLELPETLSQRVQDGPLEGTLALEFMSDGWMSLSDYVDQRDARLMTEEQVLDDALTRFAALARATDLLHSAGFYHGDLHGKNVFVHEGIPSEVRLFDFGMSRPWRKSDGPLDDGDRAIWNSIFQEWRPSDVMMFFRCLMQLLGRDDRERKALKSFVFDYDFYRGQAQTFEKAREGKLNAFRNVNAKAYVLRLTGVLGSYRVNALRALIGDLFAALDADGHFGEAFFKSSSYQDLRKRLAQRTVVNPGVALMSQRAKKAPTEKIKFDKVLNACKFRVTRQRASSKVISVGVWKANLGYLHPFEFAASTWSTFLSTTYGKDWNLRIYVDASISKTLDSKSVPNKGAMLTLYNRTESDLFEIIETAVDAHPNLELWQAECPNLHEHASPQSPLADSRSSQRLASFMMMVRFHPFFDPSVEWAVEQNFELMTSHHEAELVREWMLSQKTFFFTARHRTYTGNYEMNMEKWHAQVKRRNENVAAALAPMWAMDDTTKADYYPYGRMGEHRNSIEDRNMLLACFVGVKGGTLSPGLWDVMIEAAKLSQPKYGQYGVDEIALNLVFKFLPIGLSSYRRQFGSLSENDFFAIVFGKKATLLRSPSLVSKYDVLPAPISPANTFAVPRSWDLSRVLYDLALLQPYAGTPIAQQYSDVNLDFQYVSEWLGNSLEGGLTWPDILKEMVDTWNSLNGVCALVCESGPFCQALGGTPLPEFNDNGQILELIADALWENKRCRPLQAWLYKRLIIGTKPAPSECNLLCEYKQLIWRASAENIGAIRPNIPWTNTILGLDIASVYTKGLSPSHVLSPKIWAHAFLQEILIVFLHEPGGVTKTKNGLLERQMMKDIFEDKKWRGETPQVMLRDVCGDCIPHIATNRDT